MKLNRAPKIAAVLLTATLVTPLLAGCDEEAQTTPADGETQNAEATADGEAGDQASSGSTFSYSTYIDENGHWKDVKALDYVELCDYKNIVAPSDEVVPTDEEVQAEVDIMAKNQATSTKVTDRAVADGDTINIDYVGTIDGVEFEGGNTNGNGTTVTIGVTQYIDDFLEQLVGHEPGETFDIEVTFPEDYSTEEGSKDLNGKDAVFKVTINYIVEKTIPEVTDEWVNETFAETYGWTTVAEMEQTIRDGLQTNALASYVQDYVTDNSTISEVPEIIAQSQLDALVQQYQSYADSFGMELSQMLSMAAGVETVEELAEKNSEALDRVSRSYLVFQAIAEDAGIEVNESDVLEYFKSSMGVSDLTELGAQYGMPYLKLCTLARAVEDLLLENVTIE